MKMAPVMANQINENASGEFRFFCAKTNFGMSTNKQKVMKIALCPLTSIDTIAILIIVNGWLQMDWSVFQT